MSDQGIPTSSGVKWVVMAVIAAALLTLFFMSGGRPVP